MCGDRFSQSTTDDALKSFFPGQKLRFKPCYSPTLTFTISKLFTPVTRSIVVLAKLDSEATNAGFFIPEKLKETEVVVKIYDPRYLNVRIPRNPSIQSHPWSPAHERAAEIARPQNAVLSDQDLIHAMHRAREENVSVAGGSGARNVCTDTLSDNYYALREEQYYRFMMNCFDTELTAYNCLYNLQGSAIPHLVSAGMFFPPLVERAEDDGSLTKVQERAICPPALVLEYIPSVSLKNLNPSSFTLELFRQLFSILQSFPHRGVIHGGLTLTNIRFASPTESPTRVFIIDFGRSILRNPDDEDWGWVEQGKSDIFYAREVLEEKRTRKPSRFQLRDFFLSS